MASAAGDGRRPRGDDARINCRESSNLKEHTLRRVFAGLAALLVLVIVVQFFLAASGAFSTAPKDESFQPHRALGYVIFLLPVVMTIVAALARMPGRLIGMAALIAGLTVVQVVIAVLATAFDDTGGTSTTAGQFVFGLHAINGLIMLALAMTVAQRARGLSRSAVTAQPAS
jgi:FtsH-binding integral membrane protein